MSMVFDHTPDARDSLEMEAGLILRAFELAADQPHGFTLEDLERVEAYWVHLPAAFSSLGCVVSLSDGRRFHLAYVAGTEPEDEPEDTLPEAVTVTQMMTTEPLPSSHASGRASGSAPGSASGRASLWIDDVAALNRHLGLPPLPPAPAPVLLPLPPRH
ncbi:MAG: hypothetical protein HQ465_21920 [Rhodospirillales bacterium]|nr:hypothetical protein [Rhodospirillales bacterium]